MCLRALWEMMLRVLHSWLAWSTKADPPQQRVRS